MKDVELTREGLLNAILSWYADPGTWEQRSDPSPYSSGRSCRATQDSGRVARAAVSARGIGGLLTALCDAHGIALTALARRAGLTDFRIGEIARGSDPSQDEAVRLSSALAEVVRC